MDSRGWPTLWLVAVEFVLFICFIHRHNNKKIYNGAVAMNFILYLRG